MEEQNGRVVMRAVCAVICAICAAVGLQGEIGLGSGGSKGGGRGRGLLVCNAQCGNAQGVGCMLWKSLRSESKQGVDRSESTTVDISPIRVSQTGIPIRVFVAPR